MRENVIKRCNLLIFMSFFLAVVALSWGFDHALVEAASVDVPHPGIEGKMRSITQAEREAAAARFDKQYDAAPKTTAAIVPVPGGVPDYFGLYPITPIARSRL